MPASSLVERMVTELFHRDDEGRPIRESRTPREFLRPGDIEHKTCPYPGGRFQHEKPMNASALRQISAHWDEICDALAVLSAGYGRPVRDVMDLWRVSQLASALPWFYLFRRGSIPAFAAALAKAAQGTGMWTQHMLVRQLTRGWQPPAFTPEGMAADAEASGTLIGVAEVCAGSDKMLARFFAAYLEPGAGTGAAELAAIRDEVVAFGAHYASFKLLAWLYYLARRFVLHDLGTPAAAALLEAPCEPADFFVLEGPREPRPMRAAWLAPLAKLVAPFAPDGSDAPHKASALQLALVSGLPGTPAETFARLDAVFAEAVARVETAFGGSTPPATDALIAPGTRAALQAS